MLADLRHAVRGLRKVPALSAVAIASLALGIGANVTAYSAAAVALIASGILGAALRQE